MSTKLTAAQVTKLRARINAAHAAGDSQTADKLQAQLHAHFAAQADAFMASQAGKTWMARVQAAA